MFNVDFNEFIVNTVLSYQKHGYKDYVAYSTFIESDTSSHIEYHLVISKDDISYSGDYFNFNGAEVVFINFLGAELKQANYTQVVDKLNFGDCLSLVSNADNFIGTNALELVDYYSHVDNFNYSYSIVTNLVLCVILIYMWLRHWFAKNRDDVYG